MASAQADVDLLELEDDIAFASVSRRGVIRVSELMSWSTVLESQLWSLPTSTIDR